MSHLQLRKAGKMQPIAEDEIRSALETALEMATLTAQDIDELVRGTVGAGAAILQVYDDSIDKCGLILKADQSPVTAADMISQKIIFETLSKLLSFSSLAILSEEDTRRHDQGLLALDRAEPVLVIDPLDGTKEFLKRTGQFVINIGLSRAKQEVFGLIYSPVTDDLMLGFTFVDAAHSDEHPDEHPDNRKAAKGILIQAKGRGFSLFKASARLFAVAPADRVRQCILERGALPPLFARHLEQDPRQGRPSPKILKIFVSASHRSREAEMLQNLFENEGVEARFIALGSALKFCRIADGAGDVYLRTTPTCLWDTSAGMALVRASGGFTVFLSELSSSEDVKTGEQLLHSRLVNSGFVVFRRGFDPALAAKICQALLHK